MTKLETRQESWKECGPGSLGHYAKQQKIQILKRRLVRLGGVASICLLAAMTWSVFLPRSNDKTGTKTVMEPNYGGIVCSSVRAIAKSHLSGTLDAETTQKIELHLQECPLCRGFMEQLGNVQASKSSFHAYHGRNVSFTTP